MSRWVTVHTVTAVHPDQEPVSLMESMPEVMAEAAMADLAEESSAGSVQFPEVVDGSRWCCTARQYIHWFVDHGQLLPVG